MEILIILGLVIAGAVIMQVLAYLWYGIIFWHHYRRLYIDQQKEASTKTSKRNRLVRYCLSFIAYLLVSAFILFMVLPMSAGPFGVTLFMILVTITFAAASALPAYLLERRGLGFFFLHYGFVVISVGIISFIFALLA